MPLEALVEDQQPAVHEQAAEGSVRVQRLQDDPLQASVEKLMPLEALVEDEDDKVLHVPSYVPASMEQVCDIISKQPGIEALRLGRQVG